MSATPLACDELVRLVTDYFEGALHPSDHARFEEHLDECPHCVVYVDQMRRTIAAVGHLSEAHIPAPAQEALLTAFRDWKAAQGA
jgi:anti-sigma factor RsiW